MRGRFEGVVDRDDRADAAEPFVAEKCVEASKRRRPEEHRVGIVQRREFARDRGLDQPMRVDARAVARERA